MKKVRGHLWEEAPAVDGQDLERTLETLAALGDFERALGDMYATCATIWNDDAPFWTRFVEAEGRHAEMMGRIAGLVSSDPASFEPARPLTAAATRAQVEYIKERTRKFADGSTAPRTALLVAAELERSVLEQRFYELVATDDPEYRSLVKTIVGETEKHTRWLDERLKADA